MEPIFAGNDLDLIEALVYDSTLTPSFDPLRDCLRWKDETPNNLTSEGYDNLLSLFIARSFLQRGIPFSEHPLDPAYITEFWERAMVQGFRWPGFKRLTLNEEEKTFYETELKLNAEAEEF